MTNAESLTWLYFYKKSTGLLLTKRDPLDPQKGQLPIFTGIGAYSECEVAFPVLRIPTQPSRGLCNAQSIGLELHIIYPLTGRLTL